MALVQRLYRDDHGGPAAEFALVLPLLLMFILGTIDVGRAMYAWNQAQKATQMGVRFAVVTDFVPADLDDVDFTQIEDDPVPGGDRIPVGAYPPITCASSGCSAYGFDPDAFGNIVARMKVLVPQVEPTNVSIRYESVGLGYAGDPNLSDTAPLVTVSLTGMSFRPFIGILFNQALTLPAAEASMTMEDGEGSQSY